MGLAFTPVSLVWVAYAVAAAGLIALVLRARPISRGNVALVALLGQQVWAVSAGVGFFTADDPATQGLALQLALPAWLLWAPLVFLAGPLLLGDAPGARVVRAIGAAGALPSLLLGAAWPLAPGLVVQADGSGLTPLAAALLLSVFLGFAFTVAVLAREALTTPLPVRRGQYALLAAAFSVEGAYHAAQNAAKIALGLDFHGQAQAGPLLGTLGFLPVLLLGGVAGWAMLRARRAGDADARRWAMVLAAFIGASAATGVATAPLALGQEFQDPSGAFHALWDLSALALIVYAGMRYQLFSLERRAKQSVTVAAALAMGWVAFNVVQELAEGFLAETELFAGLPASGIVAALFVGVVSVPIGKTSQMVGQRLFPSVFPGEDYAKKRNLALYRAALEGAFADGVATPKEAASLRQLRAALELSEADHEALEQDIRAHLADAARPAAATAA